jgi:peptide chain release factor 1
MFEKLEELEARFAMVMEQMGKPGLKPSEMSALNKERTQLEPIVETFGSLRSAKIEREGNRELLSDSDPEMKEMAKSELSRLDAEIEKLEENLKLLLLPKDPNDQKNVILEIRGGTGGDEAALFAGQLFQMYSRFAERMRWKVELLSSSEGSRGGFKEVIASITGDQVFAWLKFEAGVHRVQRVPQTETQGRVHTSAATVMVLPEAEEFDVQIDMNDVRVDFFCSSGPGGQSVNTTKSAVRLTHIPTGLVAQCQDQKSQHKNKDKAFGVLRSRLYEQELAKKQAEDATKRTSQVSSGDRSAKIRTYNYAQGRVTDHRVGLTLYDLGNIMNGDIQKIVDELQLVNNMEKLKEASEVF